MQECNQGGEADAGEPCEIYSREMGTPLQIQFISWNEATRVISNLM